ncbi:MAG: ABC transporter permease [Armatimonadota bacterium]|nr:ABC transporter permease [Armatimonadota bacterium]
MSFGRAESMSYLVQRVLVTVPTVVGVITLAFLLVHIAPGDPAELMLGDYIGVSPQVLSEVRERLGLDRPIGTQYVTYVAQVARGDLGRSFRTNQPVAAEIAVQAPFTVVLAVAGVVLAVLLGVPAGIVTAMQRNTPTDYVTMTVAMIWLSSPSFWFGILLIYVFAYRLGWFPVFGAGAWGDWRSLAVHLVLPAAAIGVRSAALIARMTRSSMLEVLNQDYIRTARAKGLASAAVVLRHALRNAAIPVITVIGLDIAYLLGGAVVTETVFSRPGLGKLVVDAIYARDYPMVQGAIMVFAIGILLVNLLVDLSYALVDPRVRYA